MTGEPAFALHEPVTAVIRGVAEDEYSHLIGAPAALVRAVQIDCDGETFVIPRDVPGVEVLHGHAEVVSPDGLQVIRQAVADAVAYCESGIATVGCNACTRSSGRCPEHAIDSPRVAAYREILARLSGA